LIKVLTSILRIRNCLL